MSRIVRSGDSRTPNNQQGPKQGRIVNNDGTVNAPKDDLHMSWKSLADNKVLTEVDIIVPYHGQYERVCRLVDSLWKSTKGIYYNLCLVDDGSPNGNFLETLEGMNVPSMFFARNEERKGFGASLNLGLSVTKSPWVVFCNSDVEFNNVNWLKNLGNTYHSLRGQNVKMVSAKMDNAPPGDPRVLSEKFDHKNKPDANDVVLTPENLNSIVEEDMYLPFVCVLAHRDLFSKIGPVKEYPLGWYEDVEFACRMYSRGYKQAICGSSTVLHEGAVTVNSVCETDPKTKKVFESNFDRCCNDIRLLKNNSKTA